LKFFPQKVQPVWRSRYRWRTFLLPYSGFFMAISSKINSFRWFICTY